MNNEMDLKALWHKQEAKEMPDVKELFKTTDDIKRKLRRRLVLKNLTLLSVSAWLVYLGFNIANEVITTKIGLAVMIAGILMYLVVQDGIFAILFKTNFDISLHEYLDQLIRIKRKEDFLNKVMINIYYVFLCIGMGLYLMQFVNSLWNGIITYSIVFGWILFVALYLRPCGVKRKQKPLVEMIAKLEELNKQLDEVGER